MLKEQAINFAKRGTNPIQGRELLNRLYNRLADPKIVLGVENRLFNINLNRERSQVRSKHNNNPNLVKEVNKFIKSGSRNRKNAQILLNRLYNQKASRSLREKLRNMLQNLDRAESVKYKLQLAKRERMRQKNAKYGLTNTKKREAAKTIKRYLLKGYTFRKYFNWVANQAPIKAGHLPTHAAALMRRMKYYPLYIKEPLYRGFSHRSVMRNLLANKELQNSFASFTVDPKVAQYFASFTPDNSFILSLPPGRYPGINSRTFGGLEPQNKEITLAPGSYMINKSKPVTNMNGYPVIPVKYKPYGEFRRTNYYNQKPKNA